MLSTTIPLQDFILIFVSFAFVQFFLLKFIKKQINIQNLSKNYKMLILHVLFFNENSVVKNSIFVRLHTCTHTCIYSCVHCIIMNQVPNILYLLALPRIPQLGVFRIYLKCRFLCMHKIRSFYSMKFICVHL